MGADLILAWTPEPEDWDVVVKRVKQIDPLELRMVVNDYAPWIIDEFDTPAEREQAGRQHVLNAIEEARFDGYRRDTVLGNFGGRVFVVSGGMSWGDTPSDSFDSIAVLSALGITDDNEWGITHPPSDL